jgi:hypothetical protein
MLKPSLRRSLYRQRKGATQSFDRYFADFANAASPIRSMSPACRSLISATTPFPPLARSRGYPLARCWRALCAAD